MIQGHGGNIFALADKLGCPASQVVDMSSNINPLGTIPGILAYVREHMDTIGMLPEVDGHSAVASLAELLNVDASQVLAGNGTTQFIYTACTAMQSKKVLIVGPTYADYSSACRMHNITPDFFLADRNNRFVPDLEQLDAKINGFDTVFICNPNNPTGQLIPHQQLAQLCRNHPKTHFIIDESYLAFVPKTKYQSMSSSPLDNVAILWSSSKIFGIPGLRTGFLIAAPSIVSRFRNYMQPWCVNSLAQSAIHYLGQNIDHVNAFIEQTRDYLKTERLLFQDRLQSCPQLILYPTTTSYFLIGLPNGITATTLCSALGEKRFLIRNCSNFHGLSEQYVRIALKDPETNRMVTEHLVTFIRDRYQV